MKSIKNVVFPNKEKKEYPAKDFLLTDKNLWTNFVSFWQDTKNFCILQCLVE